MASSTGADSLIGGRTLLLIYGGALPVADGLVAGGTLLLIAGGALLLIRGGALLVSHGVALLLVDGTALLLIRR